MNPRSNIRQLRLFLKSHLRQASYSLGFTPDDNPVGLLYARMNYDSR